MGNPPGICSFSCHLRFVCGDSVTELAWRVMGVEERYSRAVLILLLNGLFSDNFSHNVVYFQSQKSNKHHPSVNQAHQFREQCEMQGFPLRKRSVYFTRVYWACVPFSWLSRVQNDSYTTWSSPSSDPPGGDFRLRDKGPPVAVQTVQLIPDAALRAENVEPVDMTMIFQSFPFDLKCIHYSGRPITKIESVECFIHIYIYIYIYIYIWFCTSIDKMYFTSTEACA